MKENGREDLGKRVKVPISAAMPVLLLVEARLMTRRWVEGEKEQRDDRSVEENVGERT